MEKFAERLNELFERTGTTRRSLARALGVSERMVQYYITGAKDPTAETLVAIADFFDVSLDYLVGRSDNQYWKGSVPMSDLQRRMREIEEEIEKKKKAAMEQMNELQQEEQAIIPKLQALLQSVAADFVAGNVNLVAKIDQTKKYPGLRISLGADVIEIESLISGKHVTIKSSSNSNVYRGEWDEKVIKKFLEDHLLEWYRSVLSDRNRFVFRSDV